MTLKIKPEINSQHSGYFETSFIQSLLARAFESCQDSRDLCSQIKRTRMSLCWLKPKKGSLSRLRHKARPCFAGSSSLLSPSLLSIALPFEFPRAWLRRRGVVALAHSLKYSLCPGSVPFATRDGPQARARLKCLDGIRGLPVGGPKQRLIATRAD